MRHIVLTGDPASVNEVLKTVMDKLGKHVKSLAFVQSVIVVHAEPPKHNLKILSEMGKQPPQMQFANVANATVLYQLPGDEVLAESEYLPQQQGG